MRDVHGIPVYVAGTTSIFIIACAVVSQVGALYVRGA